MKKLHLICNAHIDPVWLWQWKEGAAESVSTFRVAVDFCEKYEGFVFNHNEALLYEWIEEYEPELFERIKKLVKEGKWKIMGGWYLQPDCTMLSGESFLSQIDLGRKYFKEKFKIEPKTAINFDPFGHTKGLVQILKKTGFEAYVFQRPMNFFEGDFIWKGFCDSEIIAHNLVGSYNSLKGEALNKITGYIDKYPHIKNGLQTWGVGNHGGGPSKIDLESLNNLIKESEDIEIVHSDFDSYFEEIDKSSLKTVSDSLYHVNVGCYTSMIRVKKKHRTLENNIAIVQKMASYASLTRDYIYPEKEINEIRKMLAFSQFHDILPGTCIKPAEEDALRTMDCALEKCDKIIAKAFFKLAKGQKKANEGEIPIMVYNPHPYTVKTVIECEFMLQNQNWNYGEITLADVYDENGNKIKSQNEKPECTFNLDWIEKVSFEAELKPSSMNRFDCKLYVVKKEDRTETENSEKIVAVGECSKLVINKKTGLIEEFSVNNEIKIRNSGVIEVYNDDEDPWGMNISGFTEKIGEFKLLSAEETAEFFGYENEKTAAVKIVEDGAVRTIIQAVFGYKKSTAVVEYTYLKNHNDLDVSLTIYSNEANKCIKYRIDSDFCGKFYGQTAFGTEELRADGNEAVYQKWCGIKNNENALYVINDGIYGGSFKENSMYITLLRTPVYSAHPIEDRQIAPHSRHIKRIDMGERCFNFKITTDSVEQKALFYNEKPVVISYFPHAEEAQNVACIEIDNKNIILSLIKKDGNDYILHLYNSNENMQKARINGSVCKNIELTFNGFELKFIKLNGDEI